MTNKIVQRSIEEFLADYTPNYNPIMPLLMGNAVQYELAAGTQKLTRLEAVGDLRSKFHGPKDTELHQIGAKEGSKVFAKYFFASQFINSELQDSQGVEDVQAQVLDEHNKQADELLLSGEGVANANMKNNGLFYSADANYVLNSSVEVAKATDGTHLADLYAQIVAAVQAADDYADGQKLVLLYGALTVAKYNGLFAENTSPFPKVLADGLPEVQVAKIPTSIVPGGGDGFIVVNLAKVRLHYILLPTLKAQGVNEEKMYAWSNFLMGSSMVEVTAKGGVIRQPLTYEA
jgi:hypothetical protein